LGNVDRYALGLTEQKAKSLEEYIEATLKNEFSDIDVDEELKKFTLWWAGERKTLKKPKLAFRNWLNNARKYKAERVNGAYKRHNQGYGKHQRSNQKDESKYTTGRYGKLIK